MTLNDGKIIDEGHGPYFVAEINSSHRGSMQTAKWLIEAAAECGCDSPGQRRACILRPITKKIPLRKEL